MSIPAWTPGKLLQVSGAYWQSCALHAAVKLDVFTVLDAGPLDAAQAAERLGTDKRATAMLLNAMAAFGLLNKDDGVYANTEAAARFLVREAPGYLGHMILHHHHLAASWTMMDQAVRSGGPVRDRASFGDPAVREAFLMGMFNNAMLLAPSVAAAVDVSDRRRLLDLGGGPGTYAICFCQTNPELRATVFDLPTTRPFAERTIARFGLSERVGFADGNYLTDPVPAGFDVAWLSHVLHGEGPENAARIIAKAAGALVPGGRLLVHDFILDDSGDGPLFAALFSLNMLLGTQGGQSYTEGEVREMLAAAGGRDVRRLDFHGPTDSGILCATGSRPIRIQGPPEFAAPWADGTMPTGATCPGGAARTLTPSGFPR
jgi:SAM-dependent methyltransferase